jgi:hypothetical protein
VSGRHVGIVFRHSKHAGSELLVLACIAETLNDSTNAWSIYVAEIARRCKLSSRQVSRAIASLRDSGELLVRSNGGPRGQNTFTLGLRPMTPVSGTEAAAPGPMTPTSVVESATAAEPMSPVSGVDAAPKTPMTGVIVGDGAAPMTPVSGGDDMGVMAPLTPMSSVTIQPEITTLSPAAAGESAAQARAMAATLRAEGIANATASPQLIEVVKRGGTHADVIAAVGAADHAGNPFAYGVAALLNRLKSAGSSVKEHTAGAATTKPYKDPALQKIEQDSRRAAPMPQAVRELRQRLKGARS